MLLKFRRFPWRIVIVDKGLAQLVKVCAGFILGIKGELRAQYAQDQFVNVALTLYGNGIVNLIEGVLLQINRVKEVSLQVDDKVFHTGTFFTDNLHHLLNFGTAAEHSSAVFHLRRSEYARVF